MMNEFIVTVNNKKKNIKILSADKALIDGVEQVYNISKVNNHSYLLRVGKKVYDITSSKVTNGEYDYLIYGNYFNATVRTTLEEKANEFLKNKQKTSHHDIIKSPMPGLVLKIKKNIGDQVEFGESIIILEAMKMENDLKSPATGTIKEILVKEGASVEKGEIILKIE